MTSFWMMQCLLMVLMSLYAFVNTQGITNVTTELPVRKYMYIIIYLTFPLVIVSTVKQNLRNIFMYMLYNYLSQFVITCRKSDASSF